MENKTNYPVNSLRLCIDKKDEDIHGRLYCTAGMQALIFDSFYRLLMLGEEIFDYLQTPQAYQQKRAFRRVEGYLETTNWTPWENPLRIYQECGSYATYDIIVQTRKKTSWQGLLKDHEGNVLGYFASDLELLHMLMKL